MQSFVMPVSSPSASLCSLSPSHSFRGECDAWGHEESMPWLRNNHPFLCLPTKNVDRRFKQVWSPLRTVALAAAPVRRKIIMNLARLTSRWNLVTAALHIKALFASRKHMLALNFSVKILTKNRAIPIPSAMLTLENACIDGQDNFRSKFRWNLDDVERISRGLPSKAKTGSRAVPHRLNAEERKAFELAKRRGYVVQKANNRRYPLINSYRNYCDALGLPCIRIELGTTGLTDEVVIDFTPLHLSEADLSILRAEITKAIKFVTDMDNGRQASLGEVPEVDGGVAHTEDDSPPFDTQEESGLPDLSVEPVEETSFLEVTNESLRVQAASRNMTKVISLTALDAWRSLSSKS